MRLNKQQRTLTGEILGNISAAWFGAGIIVPLFTKPFSLEANVFSFLAGSILFAFFYFLALRLLRN